MDYSGTLLLGRYRILRFLGEGGMSRVYKAQDITNDTLVAVKFMKRGVTSSYIEDFIRFRKELDIVSRLEHPGIARVFDDHRHLNSNDRHVDSALFFMDNNKMNKLSRR